MLNASRRRPQGQIPVRPTLRENEAGAYQHLADSAVGQNPMVQQPLGGGRSRRLRWGRFFMRLGWTLALSGLAVWVVWIAVLLGRLGSH